MVIIVIEIINISMFTKLNLAMRSKYEYSTNNPPMRVKQENCPVNSTKPK